MPLIVICGPPCSGKTTHANAIAERFEGLGYTVHIVNEESVHLSRSASHSSPENEKILRQTLRAAADRVIGRTAVVIADGLNDMRSLRYEWYCAARAVPTTYCVVQCVSTLEKASAANEEKRKTGLDCYDTDSLVEVYNRFESPPASNPSRWDRPLFICDDEVDLDGIMDAIIKSKAPTPHESTKPEAATALYTVDKLTRDITMELAKSANSIGAGDVIKVPHATEPVRFSRPVTAAELRGLRRDFLKVAERNRTWSNEAAANTFVAFLTQTMSS